MYVRFTTDTSVAYKGFQLRYNGKYPVIFHNNGYVVLEAILELLAWSAKSAHLSIALRQASPPAAIILSSVFQIFTELDRSTAHRRLK